MTEEKKQLQGWLQPKGFKIIVGLIVFVTGLIAFVFSVGTELSNNITLIVEVGVGIIIAIIVYRTTKISEIQNKETLRKIESILEEQKTSKLNRRIYFRNNLHFHIFILSAYIADIKGQKISSSESENRLEFTKKEMNNLLGFCVDILTGVEIARVQALLVSIDNLKYDLENKKDPELRILLIQKYLQELREMFPPRYEPEYYPKNAE